MMRSSGCLLLSPLGPLLLLLLFLVLLLPDPTPVAAQRGASSLRWQTLSGNEPAVIARGGFSGIFPESSYAAYAFVDILRLPSTPLWCDVQMTKDAVGICLTNVDLANCTDIKFPYSPYKDEEQTYVINGRNVTGWFPVNYTYDQLWNNVALIRSILSRPPYYDGIYRILTVEDVGKSFNQSLWLNIEHDLFYNEFDLNITKYIIAVSRNVSIAYISSPEVDFLRNIAATFAGSKTKLIFRFPEDETEKNDLSTNQTYESLLKNLTFIKTFASGILIPKRYIWPVTPNLFLKPNTSIVTDAHKDGLEVFASGFANEVIAYNYSYDPVSEYRKFIDNGKFSVDGLLSDFPSTAWEAIRCFSYLGDNNSTNKTLLVITHDGDSGDYPTCTDRAYEKAIRDGADIIDCSVQVTKDPYLICLSSIDLQSSTTVTRSPFGTRLSEIPEIQAGRGIFSFNFTLEEIQKNLKPEISNPFFSKYTLLRNPANKNAGAFMPLDEFLKLAKDQNGIGVMITVENARFLRNKLAVDIIDMVMKALNDAGLNQTSTKVMIQSSSSSTLIPFREKTKHKIVYKLNELVRDVDLMALNDIKKFAHAVAVRKRAIFRTSKFFLTDETNLVRKLRSAKLEVYAYVLKNEFVSIPWDFFGDAITEIHNFVEAGVNGVITDFPATSDRYRRNTCLKGNFSIPLIEPGLLIHPTFMPSNTMPPTEPPLPSLSSSNVSEPALPPVLPRGATPPPPNCQSPPALPSPLFVLTISVGLLWSLKW